MPQRVFSLLAAGLLAAAPLRAQEGPADLPEATAAGAMPAIGEAADAHGDQAIRLELRAPAQRASGPSIQQAAGSMGPGGKINPYREHAPLALFSLGSLAVGGVFYGIHRSLDNPGGAEYSGDGTRVNAAIGAAGLSALAAGAAYLWYTLRAERPDGSLWSETVAAGLSSDGAAAASVTLPLSSLID